MLTLNIAWKHNRTQQLLLLSHGKNNRPPRIVTRLSYGCVHFSAIPYGCVALMHTGLVHSLDAILAFGKKQARSFVSIVRALLSSKYAHD
jgi:hypothetical protein